VWLKNLPLKLTALGLALLLWFHVATNRKYDYALEMALTPALMPNAFAMAQPLPERIRVLVSGSGKEVIRLLWDDVHAAMLIEPWMDTSVALTPDRLLLQGDADVTILQVIEPAVLHVHVDTLVERTARVHFQGEYTMEAGVSLERFPVVEPEQVVLRGPRAGLVDLVSVGTRSLDMRLLTESVERSVDLDLAGRYNVSVDPERVVVRFAVAPSVRREIPGIPVQAPRGWRADPPTVTLSVLGAEARLDSLGPEYYRAAVTPVQELLSDSLASVQATVPPLVEILAVSPDRVRITRR